MTDKHNLIGKRETELYDVIENYRIVSRDGKPYIITHDYNSDRLNIYIEDGIIVKVNYG